MKEQAERTNIFYELARRKPFERAHREEVVLAVLNVRLA